MPNPIKNRFTMPRLSPPPRYRVEQRGRVYCVVADGHIVSQKWTRKEAEDSADARNAWARAQAERAGA